MFNLESDYIRVRLDWFCFVKVCILIRVSLGSLKFNSLWSWLTRSFVIQVLQLLRSGGNDAEMEETWNKIGDYFSERHKWDEAVQYYEKARNIDQVKPQSNIFG
jgi:hypothetical protein